MSSEKLFNNQKIFNLRNLSKNEEPKYSTTVDIKSSSKIPTNMSNTNLNQWITVISKKKRKQKTTLQGGILSPVLSPPTHLVTTQSFLINEIECGGRGYCGYRCLAYSLLGNANKYKEIITDILEYLQNHPDVFNYFVNQRPDFENFSIPLHQLTLDFYTKKMKDHLDENTFLPEFLWLGNLGLQVITLCYKINIILYHAPTSSSQYYSQLIRGQSCNQYSLGIKNISNSHWRALVPAPQNLTKQYPISQEILLNNSYLDDFQTAPQVVVQEELTPRVNNLNFSTNRNLFTFSRTEPHQNQVVGIVNNNVHKIIPKNSSSGAFQSNNSVSNVTQSTSETEISTGPNTQIKQFLFKTFEKLQFEKLIKDNTCPGCNANISNYRGYCTHLRRAQCEPGKLFVNWKKSHLQEKHSQQLPTAENLKKKTYIRKFNITNIT